MSYVDVVAKSGPIPAISPASTSYFSAPSPMLDPKLFDMDEKLHEFVRTEILNTLFDFLKSKFKYPVSWTKVWLAGSGVSYQWEAVRSPGDLDCLLGIDYVRFRQSNPDYVGFSDQEIAKEINEMLHDELMPKTANWHNFELTFYVNEQSDIRNIQPYAAYDVVLNDWVVEPVYAAPPRNPDWELRANRDYEKGAELVGRYSSALEEVKNTNNPAYRINAESRLKLAAEQAEAFYDDIHSGRKIAFSRIGAGYADFNNFRWQAGKKTGVIQALRTIKEHKAAAEEQNAVSTYGVELPDAHTMIRRALKPR